MSLRIVDLILDLLTSDPGSPEDGQFWYNDTDNRHKMRQNGATRTVSQKEELDTHEGLANPHGTTLEDARTAGDTFSGDVNMGGNKVTNAATDSAPASLATNQKVDDKIRAKLAAWDPQESVLDKDILDPTPLTPSTGDRYLILGIGAGAWVGKDNQIAEWDGAAWYYTIPTLGTHTFVEDESRKYEFVGSSWQFFEETHDHGELIGLTDIADHPGYLDLAGTRPMTGALDMGSNAIGNVGLVDGVDVSAHAARHIRTGADEIDGDKIDIDFTPSTYVPNTTPPETDHVDELTAHLSGIDAALAFATGLEQKSGRVLAASFAGNPKTATVTFSAAFSDTNYSVQVTVEGTVSFAPRVDNKTTGGFDINMGANNITGLVLIGWIATADGET
jgi:hypothetical protein